MVPECIDRYDFDYTVRPLDWELGPNFIRLGEKLPPDVADPVPRRAVSAKAAVG